MAEMKFAPDARKGTAMDRVAARNPGQLKFQQAAHEIYDSVKLTFAEDPDNEMLFELLSEPERVIMFKVLWYDDKNEVQMNRGFRVQYNSALGPYKGGLRFHPTVNLDTLKFLGFEQIFKNSLTGLMLGGGKGGSDFDPKGKSNAEIRKFCEAFMMELSKHIGPNTDVPAGDIGVGGREVGYMYNMYRKIKNCHDCVLTGKHYDFGGSYIRPEATGFGLVYLVQEALKRRFGGDFKGKKVAVSGSGNVAQFAARKVLQLGGTVVSLSDSKGLLLFPNGVSEADIDIIETMKLARRSLVDFSSEVSDAGPRKVEYRAGATPWTAFASSGLDVALPCATENELLEADATALCSAGVKIVGEGANMPCTPEAIQVFNKNKVLYLCGKAANAGGVAVSGLEMAQDAAKLQWTKEYADEQLKNIMVDIYVKTDAECNKYGCNFADGANIAGFRKLLSGMKNQGIC
jgi:glutamate dehydrogenase (NADP+)